jgi:predicted Ser/Thr protein kinase
MSLVSIDGEKLKKLKGFKIGNEILISDSDSMTTTDANGNQVKAEEVAVLIEPSLIKYWITDCGLLDELGVNATLWD